MSIVVGYLSGDRGEAALKLALAEARLRNTDLVVVHSIKGGANADDEEMIDADVELAAISRRLENEGVEYQVRNFVRGNDPAKDIVLAADEHDAALVVIGLRRRTAAGKFLLGSNAHDILMDAPCPVLSVKAD